MENDSSIIPRFNTRRSLRQGNANNRWRFDSSNMPPITLEGFLERKQQHSGGKRSTIRSWKTYYTVLSGQLLCFFKDQNDFKDAKAASQPLFLHNATCEVAHDYHKKRKHVIRLQTADNSEFLLQATSKESQDEWLEKLQLTSKLEPSESVKKSSLSRPSEAPPAPPPPANEQHNDLNEPLYANVDPETNHVQESPEHAMADTSYSSTEVDAKEKRGGRLSKFLGLRPKVSTNS